VRSAAIFLDPEREREFRECGFTVVPLLAPDEVETAAAALDAILRRRPVRASDGDLRGHHSGAEGSSGEGRDGFHISYYSPDTAYQLEMMALVRGLFAPVLGRAVTGYRVNSGGAFIKAPGGGEMAVHRDYNVTADLDEVTFTAWCPLVDADSANGTLHLLPGSHRITGQIAGPGVEPFFAAYPEKIRDRCVAVPVRAGEALLFQTGTVHWSPPNRTGRTRSALHFIGLPKAAASVLYFPAPGGFEIRHVPDGTVYEPSDPPPVVGFRRHVNPPLSFAQVEWLTGGPRERWGDRLRRGLRRLATGAGREAST
jgi:hypothetical protein